MSFGRNFVLTLFTNDAELAAQADAAGINRIGLDLEVIGKAQRQAHLKTWVSDHLEHELIAIKNAIDNAQLFVRTNPIHASLQAEIDRCIEMGAQVLMLPYFTEADHAKRFIDYVAGRAEVSLLIETAQAAVRIEQIVRIKGIDEIHIGLNDLHLSIGLRNHFELLGSALMDMLSQVVADAGIPFGFGGIGRYRDPRLPVRSDLVYAQYPHLHADRALVSRVFVTPDYHELDLGREVAQFRERMDHWDQSAPELREQARDEIRNAAQSFNK